MSYQGAQTSVTSNSEPKTAAEAIGTLKEQVYHLSQYMQRFATTLSRLWESFDKLSHLSNRLTASMILQRGGPAPLLAGSLGYWLGAVTGKGTGGRGGRGGRAGGRSHSSDYNPQDFYQELTRQGKRAIFAGMKAGNIGVEEAATLFQRLYSYAKKGKEKELADFFKEVQDKATKTIADKAQDHLDEGMTQQLKDEGSEPEKLKDRAAKVKEEKKVAEKTKSDWNADQNTKSKEEFEKEWANTVYVGLDIETAKKWEKGKVWEGDARDPNVAYPAEIGMVVYKGDSVLDTFNRKAYIQDKEQLPRDEKTGEFISPHLEKEAKNTKNAMWFKVLKDAEDFLLQALTVHKATAIFGHNLKEFDLKFLRAKWDDPRVKAQAFKPGNEDLPPTHALKKLEAWLQGEGNIWDTLDRSQQTDPNLTHRKLSDLTGAQKHSAADDIQQNQPLVKEQLQKLALMSGGGDTTLSTEKMLEALQAKNPGTVDPRLTAPESFPSAAEHHAAVKAAYEKHILPLPNTEENSPLSSPAPTKTPTPKSPLIRYLETHPKNEQGAVEAKLRDEAEGYAATGSYSQSFSAETGVQEQDKLKLETYTQIVKELGYELSNITLDPVQGVLTGKVSKSVPPTNKATPDLADDLQDTTSAASQPVNRTQGQKKVSEALRFLQTYAPELEKAREGYTFHPSNRPGMMAGHDYEDKKILLSNKLLNQGSVADVVEYLAHELTHASKAKERGGKLGAAFPFLEEMKARKVGKQAREAYEEKHGKSKYNLPASSSGTLGVFAPERAYFKSFEKHWKQKSKELKDLFIGRYGKDAFLSKVIAAGGFLPYLGKNLKALYSSRGGMNLLRALGRGLAAPFKQGKLLAIDVASDVKQLAGSIHQQLSTTFASVRNTLHQALSTVVQGAKRVLSPVTSYLARGLEQLRQLLKFVGSGLAAGGKALKSFGTAYLLNPAKTFFSKVGEGFRATGSAVKGWFGSQKASLVGSLGKAGRFAKGLIPGPVADYAKVQGASLVAKGSRPVASLIHLLFGKSKPVPMGVPLPTGIPIPKAKAVDDAVDPDEIKEKAKISTPNAKKEDASSELKEAAKELKEAAAELKGSGADKQKAKTDTTDVNAATKKSESPVVEVARKVMSGAGASKAEEEPPTKSYWRRAKEWISGLTKREEAPPKATVADDSAPVTTFARKAKRQQQFASAPIEYIANEAQGGWRRIKTSWKYLWSRGGYLSQLLGNPGQRKSLGQVGHAMQSSAAPAALGGLAVGGALVKAASPVIWDTIIDYVKMLAMVLGQDLLESAVNLAYKLADWVGWFSSDAQAPLRATIAQIVTWGVAVAGGIFVFGKLVTIVAALQPLLVLVRAALSALYFVVQTTITVFVALIRSIVAATAALWSMGAAGKVAAVGGVVGAAAGLVTVGWTIGKSIADFLNSRTVDKWNTSNTFSHNRGKEIGAQQWQEREKSIDKAKKEMTPEELEKLKGWAYNDMQGELRKEYDKINERREGALARGDDNEAAKLNEILHQIAGQMEGIKAAREGKVNAKQDAVGKLMLSLKSARAEPQYSSIEEAYKKIQLSALGEDDMDRAFKQFHAMSLEKLAALIKATEAAGHGIAGLNMGAGR